MKVLVLNCGSSTVKFRFFEMENEKCLANGKIEKIGSSSAGIEYVKDDGKPYKKVKEILEHKTAIEIILNLLTKEETKVIDTLKEINAIGHRVVHGGEKFSDAAKINEKVVEDIRECIDFAPLHNPHNLRGIMICKDLLPEVPQIAVFDTAFHQTIPPYSYLYALPYLLYKKYHIRRYGFHGTSHQFISLRTARLLNENVKNLKIITCHLGNGCSVAAINKGVSIDTSMGFTPLEGLIMGSRCGDIDPALVPIIMLKEDLSVNEINILFNKHSGLYGISGISNDMREIEHLTKQGDERAKLAFDMFCYRLRKYIGSYYFALNGADVISFAGGIGENSPAVRKHTLEGLKDIGIEIDEKLNNEMIGGKQGEISTKNSKVKVFVIPTNEELMIARQTVMILQNKNGG